MRNLFKYFNTVKKEIITIPIIILIEVAFEILIPVFMGILIDNGLKEAGGTNYNVIYTYGG